MRFEFSEGLRRWFLWHTLAGVLAVSLACLLLSYHAQRMVDFLLLWAASRSALTLIALALPAGLIAFLLILAVGEPSPLRINPSITLVYCFSGCNR